MCLNVFIYRSLDCKGSRIHRSELCLAWHLESLHICFQASVASGDQPAKDFERPTWHDTLNYTQPIYESVCPDYLIVGCGRRSANANRSPCEHVCEPNIRSPNASLNANPTARRCSNTNANANKGQHANSNMNPNANANMPSNACSKRTWQTSPSTGLIHKSGTGWD